MLNTFFNKTTHPILNRYHHNRMTEGVNLVKEMDTIINRLSRNHTIDSLEEEVPLKGRQTAGQKVGALNGYSKGVMKRIINN